MLAESVAAHPAVAALNHARWTVSADCDVVVDRPSGPLMLRPRVILNATGAWIDRVNARLGVEIQHVRGVKGAHVMLHHPALHARLAGQGFNFDDGRGRMVICLPLAEISYLLAAISRLFDDITVIIAHLVSVAPGSGHCRTLTARSIAPRATTLCTRITCHRAWLLLSLVSGKWTTFRSFAELASDRMLAHLGRARQLSTRDRGYTGAGAAGQDALTRRYDRIGAEVARFSDEAVDRPVVDAPSYTMRETL